MLTELPDPMRWLASGVPLTLLIDLLEKAGPDSTRVYRDEPGDAAWVPTTPLPANSAA